MKIMQDYVNGQDCRHKHIIPTLAYKSNVTYSVGPTYYTHYTQRRWCTENVCQIIVARQPANPALTVQRFILVVYSVCKQVGASHITLIQTNIRAITRHNQV